MNEVSKLVDRTIIEVVLDSTVTAIGEQAFSYCSSLASVTIPDSVTTIGNDAFDSCTSLQSITCLSTTPPGLGAYAFYNTNNCPIYVPASSLESYKTDRDWSAYADRIQAIPS